MGSPTAGRMFSYSFFFCFFWGDEDIVVLWDLDVVGVEDPPVAMFYFSWKISSLYSIIIRKSSEKSRHMAMSLETNSDGLNKMSAKLWAAALIGNLLL